MYNYQKSAEAVLIQRAKRGDIKAFSELYSRIYVELYMNIARNPNDTGTYFQSQPTDQIGRAHV